MKKMKNNMDITIEYKTPEKGSVEHKELNPDTEFKFIQDYKVLDEEEAEELEDYFAKLNNGFYKCQKSKYRIGDTFQMIGTRGYSWWKIEEIAYGAIEPIYVLKLMPFGKNVIEIGESELCENWYNTTISNLEQ